MNLYFTTCLMITKNKIIKIKRVIDGKINVYSRCGFKKFDKTIDEEELGYLLESLNFI